MRIWCGSADITPAAALPMGGFDGSGRLSRQTHGRLEANLVLFGDDAGPQAGLVSVDTLFIGAALRDRILASLATLGLAPDAVMILASHTHFAPMLDGSKPLLGTMDEGELERCADVIVEAVATAKECRASFAASGRGASDAGVNRRLRWRVPSVARLLLKRVGAIYLCDNPSGPRDRRIRTCVWSGASGEPIAAFWSFACHPTGFPDLDTASADYPGVVREHLRAVLGRRLPVIFAPGCMGDVRPRSPADPLAVRRLGSTLVYGPNPVPFTRKQWDRWAADLTAAVESALSGADPERISGRAGHAPMVRVAMGALFDGQVPVPELHAKSLAIPGLPRLVSLSCEPVTAIADLVGDENDLVLGYEGDVFGYLPTETMIAEGGYEAERFMQSFGLSGRFGPQLDKRVSGIGRSLASATGR